MLFQISLPSQEQGQKFILFNYRKTNSFLYFCLVLFIASSLVIYFSTYNNKKYFAYIILNAQSNISLWYSTTERYSGDKELVQIEFLYKLQQ